MRVRAALITATTAALLAGCGSGAHTPKLLSLPLTPGTRIQTQVNRCNRGSNAYCATELVLVNPSYRSSRALVLAERDRLKADGWIGASPYTGLELADESPHHKLRVTYATAADDLQGVELGWIRRPWPIVSALDGSLFDRTSAISVLLEVGSR
jgi:hypothetical protein